MISVESTPVFLIISGIKVILFPSTLNKPLPPEISLNSSNLRDQPEDLLYVKYMPMQLKRKQDKNE